MDRWQTFRVPLVGGLRLNLTPLEQGVNYAGSLIEAKNVEPADVSGYRRISGFTKFDSTTIPGSGDVLGAFVYNGFVVGMRGENVYQSQGSGWTQINGGNLRPSAGRYSADTYCWSGTPRITFGDGVNKPARWDGTTFTVLINAPTGAQWITEHKNHLFLATGDVLTFSAPYDEGDYNSANGAGEINVGFDITGIASWRNELYIFGETRIYKLTGSTSADFALEPVTKKLGCVDGFSIQEVGGDLVFLSHDSVRTIAGTERLNDVELGSISEQIRSLVKDIGSEYQNGNISSVALVDKAQYRLFTTRSTDSEATSQGLLGGLRWSPQGAVSWEWFQLEGIKAACADSGHINGTEFVIHGGYDGYVYRQENGNTFDGSDVEALLATPYITFDDPALRKVLQKLELFVEVEGLTDVRIATVFDYDSTDALQPPEVRVQTSNENFATYGDPAITYGGATSIYGTLPEIQTMFNLIGSCLNCSFVFSSNDSLSPYTLKELIIRYALHGGR